MSREVVALVSADDAVAAVRVHVDRVHDLLRRSGCGADEAIEVTESYSFALLDALVNEPEAVVDMAGWWFGRALDLGRRLGGTGGAEPAVEPAASVLAGTSGEAQTRAALGTLVDNERAAVVLRDAYDLPPQAVAVAVRRPVEEAAELVGLGRLHLVARYDDRPLPDLARHTGRSPVELGTLAMLADNTLPAPRAVALRRHVSACPTCEDVVDCMAKARRLAAALPVIAMPDEQREAMLERVATRAAAVLPSVDEVLAAIEEDEEVRPAISPLVVVGAIVLALMLGIGVAAITRSNLGSFGAPATSPETTASPVEPSFSVSPTASASASASGSHRPSASARPSRTATTQATTSQPPDLAGIDLSPTQGPRGTTITVTGTGWVPGDVVTVVYSGPISSSRSSAVADSHGGFVTHVTASGLVPGDYAVQANGSNATASATFRQTT